MNFLSKTVIAASLTLVTTAIIAQEASSLKHAKYATELRQSVFSLLGSNMGPLGAMAKGKAPFNAEKAEKHAIRINQLSLMIADYSRTNTTKFDVETEALASVWKEADKYSESIDNLTKASAKLIVAAQSKDKGAIKKAIGGVGKTCGGCHDDFKEE
jgi:cytochrome c556